MSVIKQPLDLEFLSPYPVRLVPVYLSQAWGAIRELHSHFALALSPLARSVDSFQTLELSNLTACSDCLNSGDPTKDSQLPVPGARAVRGVPTGDNIGRLPGSG
jgi:hypothetical protein